MVLVNNAARHKNHSVVKKLKIYYFKFWLLRI